MNVYGLFENGEMIDQGDVKQLEKKYIITSTSIYNAERTGKRLFGKYDVRLIGVNHRGKPAHPETKAKLRGFDDEILEIARRLRIYGNTTLPRIKNGDLNKWLTALKKNGYECSVKTYSRRSGNEITLDGSPFNKSKYDTNYIVTLKGKA